MFLKIYVLFFFLTSSVHAAYRNSIEYSENIKASQMLIIENDLSKLETIKLNDKRKTKYESYYFTLFTSSDLIQWLYSRIKYVIAEKDFSNQRLALGLSLYTINEDQIYPNELLVNSFGGNHFIKAAKEVSVIMSNIGTGIYQKGKSEKKLYGVKVSQGLLRKQLRIPVISPRVGVLQIGEGFFDPSFLINTENLNSMSNSIARISTFFHEARHSDGNGPSLGFSHAICPDSHELRGFMACDDSKNGAYAIGADITHLLIKNCQSCNEYEKEVLKIKFLDEKSRILSNKLLNEEPESI